MEEGVPSVLISTPKKKYSNILQNPSNTELAFPDDLSSIDSEPSIAERDDIDLPVECFLNRTSNDTIEGNCTLVRNELVDIPVSPQLKQKVRQRLFTLVNNLDGYEHTKGPEETHCLCRSKDNLYQYFNSKAKHFDNEKDNKLIENNLNISAITELCKNFSINSKNSNGEVTAHTCLCPIMKNGIFEDILKSHQQSMNEALKLICKLKEHICELEKELKLSNDTHLEDISALKHKYERELHKKDIEMYRKLETFQETLTHSATISLQQSQFMEEKFNELENQHKKYLLNIEEFFRNVKVEIPDDKKLHKRRNTMTERLKNKSAENGDSKKDFHHDKSPRHGGRQECMKEPKASGTATEVELYYEEKMKSLQEYYEAQITEYKKAVKILKKNLKET